nr:M15 family metallopeptidase [Ruegeria sp. Ofav3-42]
MLKAANDAFAHNGCELVVFDAYRTIATQRDLWNWAMEKAASENPGLSQQELEIRTCQYSSDPRKFDPADATTWPTHSTGAAVDVVLRALDTGEELDMGAAFDDLSAIAHTDYLEREWRAGRIGPDNPALLNRRLLYWGMRHAGFTNYPSEYWHFDFGNQMYMYNRQLESGARARAWYGYCQPPQRG